MSLPTTIPQAILDTVLGRLALLFLTGAAGDPTVARHAASQMLAAYNVETEEELRLAAEIICFGFHTLEALSYASDPDLSLNKICRLRGSAVSLSRESHKAQRKLDQLQRQRRAGTPTQPETPAPQPEPTPARPRIDNALGLIEAERPAKQIIGKDGGKSWSQSFQKRQTARRIAENLKKNQAQHASETAHLHAAASTQVSRPAA
ncbi:MAG: hypothetical protein P4L90_23065 [Rhodopila sp.]|nr:hypothetical protein [Rhodopila sp.]